jgi:tRNA pseudouridine32 synthase/23S rRNA pseudouridine746 synthase/23S rRNA pseudouridine1911/1915/1917 synthase
VTGWAELTAGNEVYDDAAVLVLKKPAGIAVTGERHGTDLVRLAAEAGQELFPVHRIDKVTSGAVLLAKQLRWHGGLTRQFAHGTAGKAYLAITASAGLPERGTIDLPLSVGLKSRVRVAAPRAAITAGPDGTWTADPAQVYRHVRTYPSVTAFARVWAGDRHTLLLVRPVTGRRHQIRVHLAWIGHPVAGDPLFGARGGRACLHSWRLSVDAEWRAGARLLAEAPPGEDFWAPVAAALPGGPAGVLATARRLAEEEGDGRCP